MTIKEQFKKSVVEMFTSICTGAELNHKEMMVVRGEAECATAEQLASHLESKVHVPNAVLQRGESLCLIYDNITVTLSPTLELMRVEYLEDLLVDIRNVCVCDVQQLAQFVLKLDKTLPKWKNIWSRRNRILHQKARVEEKIKTRLKEIRNSCLSTSFALDMPVEQYRLSYYNVRAEKFMLEHDVPDWVKKKTEQDILDQCMEYQLIPPLEEWCEDYDAFVTLLEEQRQVMKDNHARKLLEEKKKEHLNRLKRMKLQTQIRALDLHEGFSVETENRRWISHYFRRDDEILLTISVHDITRRFYIRYEELESKTPPLLKLIDDINDLVPRLNTEPECHLKLKAILKEMDELIAPVKSLFSI